MNEFSTQVTVKAPADDVFSYVSDISRLPDYVPTVHRAAPAGDGHIRFEGERDGHPYETTGWYQTHEFNRTMLWGAEGANRYSGDLEVLEQGPACLLKLNLRLSAMPEVKPQVRERLESRGPAIQRELDAAAHKIKKLCEQEFANAPSKPKGYVA